MLIVDARRGNGLRQPVKSLRQPRQAGLTGVGQQQCAIQPSEELYTQIILERLHLMADRGRGHVELLRRLGKAQMAAGGLKGAQRIEWG